MYRIVGILMGVLLLVWLGYPAIHDKQYRNFLMGASVVAFALVWLAVAVYLVGGH